MLPFVSQETMLNKIKRMTDDLADALMTAPLRGGNDCGCAAMIHHEPPQAAFIQGPQGPKSSVIW
ncbi:MAG: hypothetical protein LHW50_07435 [Candidatus Cloacimonetes bacterium]|nr:hypothetical protein [Candidatus Cloacimonadota bacterium]MCK9517090.1 hypothetical protein [Ottowia sp.]